MRIVALAVLFGLSLGGCQLPVVKVRHYSFDSKFVVDGKMYDLHNKYECHFEDIGWISERGPAWHIRGIDNVVRAKGKLGDGSQFEVLPQLPDTRARFCPDQTTDIATRLFIRLSPARFESFDKNQHSSASHTVQLLDNRLTLERAGLDTFVEGKDSPAPAVPTARYYTVNATVYNRAEIDRHPKINALIKRKQIVWIEHGKIVPYAKYPESDPEYAELLRYTDGLSPTSKLAFVNRDGQWLFSRLHHDALQWQPDPSFASREENGTRIWPVFKEWIIYGDIQIEMPFYNASRLFYEPEHDSLIKFSSEQAELW